MKKFGLFILIGFHTLGQNRPAEVLSLSHCIRYAWQNVPTLKQADLRIQTAENTLDQSKMSLLPSITADWGNGLNWGRNIDPYTNDVITSQIGVANVGSRASVDLFDGGQTKHSIKRNKLALENNRADAQSQRNMVALNVLMAYLQVLNSQEQLENAQIQVNLSSSNLVRLEKLHKAEAIRPSNYLELKAQVAAEKVQISNAQAGLRIAKTRLLQIMGLSAARNIDIETISIKESDIKTYEVPSDQLFKLAVSHLPEIQANAIKRQIAQEETALVRASRFPTVSLSANLGSNYSSVARQFQTTEKIPYFDQFANNFNFATGIYIRMPIFNTANYRLKTVATKIQEKNVQYESDALRLQLRQQVEEASLSLQNTVERYQGLTEQVTALREAFDYMSIGFSAGAFGVSEYMLNKTNLDRAMQSLIQTKYEYYLRKKVLDFYRTGKW